MSDSNSSGETAKVLVIDGDSAVLDLFMEIFSLDGHRVYKARRPEEALDMIRKIDFDVVISDFRMPKTTGELFFKKAIAIRPTIEKRFIFTSGEMDAETKNDFAAETGVRVISKPFRVNEMRSLVKSLLKP